MTPAAQKIIDMIDELYGDKSVSRDQLKDDLEEIVGSCEGKLECLKEGV